MLSLSKAGGIFGLSVTKVLVVSSFLANIQTTGCESELKVSNEEVEKMNVYLITFLLSLSFILPLVNHFWFFCGSS